MDKNGNLLRIVEHETDIKKRFHGNSKLLLHLFYNSITGKYEMQATTKSTELSYPQINKVDIVAWDSVNYDVCCKVFGYRD